MLIYAVRLIEQRGGQACLGNDKVLKELSDIEDKSGGLPGSGSAKAAKPVTFEDMKEDLHTDPDVAIQENMKTFTRKFDIQTRQIMFVPSYLILINTAF